MTSKSGWPGHSRPSVSSSRLSTWRSKIFVARHECSQMAARPLPPPLETVGKKCPVSFKKSKLVFTLSCNVRLLVASQFDHHETACACGRGKSMQRLTSSKGRAPWMSKSVGAGSLHAGYKSSVTYNRYGRPRLQTVGSRMSKSGPSETGRAISRFHADHTRALFLARSLFLVSWSGLATLRSQNFGCAIHNRIHATTGEAAPLDTRAGPAPSALRPPPSPTATARRSRHVFSLPVAHRPPRPGVAIRRRAAASARVQGPSLVSDPWCLTMPLRQAHATFDRQQRHSPHTATITEGIGASNHKRKGAVCCPPELRVRTPAHAKQLGWYVEFESRVTRGTCSGTFEASAGSSSAFAQCAASGSVGGLDASWTRSDPPCPRCPHPLRSQKRHLSAAQAAALMECRRRRPSRCG